MSPLWCRRLSNGILVTKKADHVYGICFRYGIDPVNTHEVLCFIRIIGIYFVVIGMLEHICAGRSPDGVCTLNSLPERIDSVTRPTPTYPVLGILTHTRSPGDIGASTPRQSDFFVALNMSN